MMKPEPGKEYPAPDEPALIGEIVQLFRNFIENKYRRPGEARRDAHAKMHGCAIAEFAVDAHLPPELRQGVFKEPSKYLALIRFSSADPDPELDDRKADVRGMAIKLLEVPGTKLLKNEENEKTQDFLLINSRFFFSPDIQDYRDFSRDFVTAGGIAAKIGGFLKYISRPAHWRPFFLLWKMQHAPMQSPLTSGYWSTVPYKLGSLAVKYSAQPSNVAAAIKRSSANFLNEAMKAHLRESDAFFDFMIQVQKDPEQMPVENSTIEWDERKSPFIKVATIRIPKQDFDSEEQRGFAENLSYTPWHALPEHQPIGGMNRVRKAVYESSSELRHRINEAKRQEPEVQRLPQAYRNIFSGSASAGPGLRTD